MARQQFWSKNFVLCTRHSFIYKESISISNWFQTVFIDIWVRSASFCNWKYLCWKWICCDKGVRSIFFFSIRADCVCVNVQHMGNESQIASKKVFPLHRNDHLWKDVMRDRWFARYVRVQFERSIGNKNKNTKCEKDKRK